MALTLKDYAQLAQYYSEQIDTVEQEMTRNNMLMAVAVKNLNSDFVKTRPEAVEAYVQWFQYLLDIYNRSLVLLKTADNNLDAALGKISELVAA